MNKQEIIQELVDFVEGRMPFDIFRCNYESKKYNSILNDVKPNDAYPYQKGETILESLEFYRNCYNWNTALGKLTVHSYILRYLQYYRIPTQPTTKYHDEHKFILNIQPNYVRIDEEFLKSILILVPTNLNKTQKKKWLKDKIKSLFKYDSKPPRWIQDPEWPIVNGKPLVFKYQTKTRKDDERVYYIFYDAETGNEITITQFY